MHLGLRGESISELQACTRTSHDPIRKHDLSRGNEMNAPTITTKAQKSATRQAGSIRHTAPTQGPRPTHANIAVRAYTIYISTGRQLNSCIRQWLQAEKELQSESKALLQLTADNNIRPLVSPVISGGVGPRRS
jgi:hypothetical protein